MGEDGVVGASNACFQAAGDVVVGGVIAFVASCGISGVLPVTILGYIEMSEASSTKGKLRTLIEGIPSWYVFIVSRDDELRVIEIVFHNLRIGPSTVRIE